MRPEQVIRGYQQLLEQARARATAAEAREAKLRAALRYYANHDNYHDGILVRSAVGTDRGKLARAALETDHG